MSKPVADHVQRARAVTPDESFIVQAPAGSGKTGLLIRRYLRLLGLVDHPEEIIAVTFTRKAAAEMQGRIFAALEQAERDEPPADDYAVEIQALARRVLERDVAQGWELRSNPGRLRIQTIDALCAHLTRRMPILSRFGAQPETLEDATALYRDAALAALDELESTGDWSESIAVLLAHLDNDLPRVRDLLGAMLARRDQWLRHVVALRRDDLEAAWRRLVEATLQTIRGAFRHPDERELVPLLAFAAENLERENRASAIRLCLRLRELPGWSAEDLEKWRGIAAFLLTAQHNWRKRAEAGIGFPAAGQSKTESEARRIMKDRYRSLLTRLSEGESLRRQLVEILYLPSPAYTDGEWQVISALCRLLILGEARLRILFARRNQVDFAGVTLAAAAALGGEDQPTDLALHLDYRIRHILVDEFQDISINQYELLRRLTAGWSPGDGHTLFLVGDPMQSIYRFRDAEVGLFVDAWRQRRLGQVPLTPLEISVNFRSSGGIVDWVNRTFIRVLPEVPDAARGAVTYAAAKAFHAEEPPQPVVIHAMAGRDADREAETVAALVEAARQRNPDGSVAILVRNRSFLTRIIPCLQAAGHRFRAVEIEALGHRPAIQDLLALTRALHHLADRVAWLAILRAPWCGLTLADLLALAGDGEDLSIWECMGDGTRLARLSEQGQCRVARLRACLVPVLAQRGRRSLRRWIESAWLAIGGPATLSNPTDLENVRTYFEMLDGFDTGGDLMDAGRVSERAVALFAAPDTGADERLQVMTIHRAKGLEFDTVIVPGLDRATRRDDPSLLLWTERPAADGSQDLLLAPIREAGAPESPIYDCLRYLLQRKQEYEEGRLLYVAATRARKQLHLLGAVNVKSGAGEAGLAAPRSGTLLAQLWPAVWGEFESALTGAAENGAGYSAVSPVIGRGMYRLPVDWRLPAPDDAVAIPPEDFISAPEPERGIEFQWAGETLRHVGTAFHQWMQRLGEEGAAAWNAARIQMERPRFQTLLLRLGVPEPELDRATDQIQEALANLIGDPRGQWLFAGEHLDARSEYALSGIYEGRLVNVKIDRTFVDGNGTRWIIDYKTSRHEGADLEDFLDREQERYRGQLEKYAVLMRRLEHRPIRAGLYFPLLRGWREWTTGC